MIPRKNLIGILLGVLTLWLSLGPPPAYGQARNPLQVGLLRWYRATEVPSFPVGTSPLGIVFDGANIWVANFNSHSLTKIRASDGATLNTITFPGNPPANPHGLAFDGANIWAVLEGRNEVIKIRASDGIILGVFPSGGIGPDRGIEPENLAFDGANIWISNRGSTRVTKRLARDGSHQGTIVMPAPPQQLAFDGDNMWVTVQGGSINEVVAVFVKNAQMRRFPLGARSFPEAVVFDGANIWVALQSAVTKLRASDGVTLGTFPTSPVVNNPRGIVFDGANIWVTGDFGVIKMRASDGLNLGSFLRAAHPLEWPLTGPMSG